MQHIDATVLDGSLDKHTYACENKAYKESHQRCPFCSQLVLKEDAEAVCSHLLACYTDWIERGGDDQATDDSEAAELAAPVTTAAELPLPISSQLSRISEGDEEGTGGTEGTEPGEGSSTSAVMANPAIAQNTGDENAEKSTSDSLHCKVLCNPLAPPQASFYFPTVKTQKQSRPLCPICMHSSAEDWRENVLGKVQGPFNDMRAFSTHFLQHLKTGQNRNAMTFSWTDDFDCSMVSCTQR